METQVNQAKLFGKIAAVMGQVRQLEKSGRNQFDKYDFVTADTVAHRIGTALAGAGVAFFPSIAHVETSEYTTAKGAANFRSVVTMQLTFACTETGATYTILWAGEAIDRSDKSISKAAVSAVKYALIKTFLLTGGDDDDADAVSPEVETRKAAPAPAANGYHDDAMWEPNEKPKRNGGKDLISPIMLGRLEELMLTYYGKTWRSKERGMVQGASKGSASAFAELLVIEAEVMIAGLTKRIAEATAQESQLKEAA
jgi:hypothetical protein